MMLEDLCETPRCAGLVYAKGLCKAHYMRQRRAQQTEREKVLEELRKATRRFIRAQESGAVPYTVPAHEHVRRIEQGYQEKRQRAHLERLANQVTGEGTCRR